MGSEMCIRDSINGDTDARVKDGKVEVASLFELDLAVKMGWEQIPVSYTHLTLPTSDLV